MIGVIQALASSKLIRAGLKLASAKCPFHGSILWKSICDYLDSRLRLCMGCLPGSLVIAGILELARVLIGIPRHQLRSKLRPPYWRRALKLILESLELGIKPFVPRAPFMIVWNFTNACNLRCIHCYQNAGLVGNQLNRSQRIKIVDELASSGVAMLAFSGGEPLMDSDFLEIAELAHQSGMYLSLATNGTLISSDNISELSRLFGYIQISLDGASPEIHDGIRGVKGCFQETLDGIKRCIEHGITTAISASLTRYNLHQIPQIYQLALELGADYFCMFNLVPAGRARAELDVTPAQRESILRFLALKALQNPKPKVLCTAPQYARVIAQLSAQLGIEAKAASHYGLIQNFGWISEFIGGCGFGRMYAAIDPDGSFKPCVFSDLVLGNLVRQSLEPLWDHPMLIEARDRSKLKGSCGACRYKYICGGCRARALAYLGDLHAPDPGCINSGYASHSAHC